VRPGPEILQSIVDRVWPGTIGNPLSTMNYRLSTGRIFFGLIGRRVARWARADFTQVAIRVDAGVVPVTPGEIQGIPAYDSDLGKFAILPGDKMVLATMSLARSTRTPAAQVVKRIPTHVAIIPRHLEQALGRQLPHLYRILHSDSYSRMEAPLHARRWC
jgi:hypothetical protein